MWNLLTCKWTYTFPKWKEHIDVTFLNWFIARTLIWKITNNCILLSFRYITWIPLHQPQIKPTHLSLQISFTYDSSNRWVSQQTLLAHCFLGKFTKKMASVSGSSVVEAASTAGPSVARRTTWSHLDECYKSREGEKIQKQAAHAQDCAYEEKLGNMK